MDSSHSEYTLSSDPTLSHRETSNTLDPLDAKTTNDNNDDRKNSASSVGSGGSHSFTQRLIDRGVAVPSSFSNWEKLKTSDETFFSPGSFDVDSHYGMSPFITPSFSTTAATAAAAGNTETDGSLYKSLKHRYEKERVGGGNASARVMTDDEEDAASSSTTMTTATTLTSPLSALQGQHKKQRAEDSDIELSDEEDASMTLEKLQLPLAQRSRRSRSPLSFPPTNGSNNNNTAPPADGIFDLMKPQNYQDMYEQAPTLSPSMQKIKQLLTTAPPPPASSSSQVAAAAASVPPTKQQQPTKPLPNPPRQHLLHTPVFQVVNANTVKDRYLFLFNDLLLICKPIMDENIIVGSSSSNISNSNNNSNSNSINRHGGSGGQEKTRYRFRPNENSLFQVKNIVPLGQLTLYISKDDLYHAGGPTTIEMGPDGRPILPPARKIHPIMASALRKFETNANLGIQYLIDKGVLTNDPLSVANFLFKTPDLNRRQLGYYLSDLKNSDVYDAFLECFRLVGLRLDEALRILLTTFRLPSNWEALEYLIERFAKKWHDANQNVIKFHEDMVVKVVVAMLFLNAECWYDATSERDVFWYARELKERQDRQAKRKMSVIDYSSNTSRPNNTMQKSSSSATTSRARQSVAVEPLHYIMSLRARGNSQPTLDDFLERWNYYDQYHLVPREFMEEMYKSIGDERLETGWDNKTGRRLQTSMQHQDPTTAFTGNNKDDGGGGVGRPKIVSPSVQQGSQDVVITVIPHRLPTRLTKGLASNPITISIPAPDAGLQIKLRGQDLVFEPNVLDFSQSCIQTFTITGNTLGRTSLMFIKTGDNAGNYVSPTLPRTKSVVVERPFMRYTFQIGFKHVDHDQDKKKMLMEEEQGTRKKEDDTNSKAVKKSRNATRRNRDEKERDQDEHEQDDGNDDDDDEAERQARMVNRKYTFSVETEEERIQWLEALKRLSGYVNEERNQKSIAQLHNMTSEARVALQVLKEVLLADEIKKGTARTTTTTTNNNNSNTNNTTATGTNNNTNVNKNNNATNANTVNNASTATTRPSLEEDRHGNTMRLLLPAKKKKDDDRNSILTTATSTSTTANVVTKRGHEIVKLVVQNSMVPLVLGFLKSQIPTDQ